MTSPTEDTPNQKYGLTEIYQHDLDENEVCKKCHQSISELAGTTKLCPVIGMEEVARVRDYDNR